MKKMLQAFKNFFHHIGKFIDKKIVVPITKLIVGVTKNFDKSGKFVENWLSRSNTLLFISLFCSIFVFIIIDQEIISFSKSSAEVLRSQPVEVIYNEEAYVVEGLPETVDITLIGSKTDLFIAKQSPTSAIRIDLSGLGPGQHKVNIKYSQSLANLEYMVNPSFANVYIYDKVSETKSLSVDVLNQDNLDSKLIINDVKLDRDKVIIKGAEHTLEKVVSVKALVDVDNLLSQAVGTQTLKDVKLMAYDKDGNTVDVEVVPSKIDVDLVITSPSKELILKVIPKGTISFGKAISSIDTSSTKVTVYGPESVLEGLNYIPIEIDVNGLKANRQYKIELDKPVGVKSMSVSSVTVNVTLDTVSEKNVDNVKIIFKNLGSNYTPNAASAADGSVTVNLKGVSSVIEGIGAGDIVAYVDLEGLTEGTHEVNVEIESTDPRVTYLSKTKKVTIKISKNN